MRSAGNGAMGGPLRRLATSIDGSIDPRFERLGLSLARMEALDADLNTAIETTKAHVEDEFAEFGQAFEANRLRLCIQHISDSKILCAVSITDRV